MSHEAQALALLVLVVFCLAGQVRAIANATEPMTFGAAVWFVLVTGGLIGLGHDLAQALR